MVKILATLFSGRPHKHTRTFALEPKGKLLKRVGNLPQPVCPYCEGLLEKIPQRKKKCPKCGNYICIRTSPGTQRRLLATKDEADEIGNLRHKRYEKQKWLDTLREFGVTKRDYEKYRTGLVKEWSKEPDQRDVFWRIFNDLAVNYGDLQDKARIYYEMALFLDEEGKDFSEVLKQHHRMVLLELKRGGCAEVKIRSSGGCAACKAQDHKIYPIEQALQEMPLPCKNCSFFMDSKKGFCRCFYQVVEDDWWQIGEKRIWMGN